MPILPSTSHSGFGLNIVFEPDIPGSSRTGRTNIVFVHGLGGSCRGTWTSDDRSFWPLWLSEVPDLECCRILLFGYDADYRKFWKPNNVLDITDISAQLLNELWLHYCEHNDVNMSNTPC